MQNISVHLFRIRYITIRVGIIRGSSVVAKDISRVQILDGQALSKREIEILDHVTKGRLLTTLNGKDLAIPSHTLCDGSRDDS